MYRQLKGLSHGLGWAFDAINGRSRPEQAPYWLNDVSCIFLSFPLITSGVYGNCSDKSGLACCLYCTKSGWHYICHFPPALAYNLHSPSANGKQGLIPSAEEMSQNLLTNKKQGNLD
jgi:hypothetical protein